MDGIILLYVQIRQCWCQTQYKDKITFQIQIQIGNRVSLYDNYISFMQPVKQKYATGCITFRIHIKAYVYDILIFYNNVFLGII